MALMRYAAKSYPKKTAITDEVESVTYSRLYEQSVHIGILLAKRYDLKPGSRVAILCRNHVSMIRAVFGISQTGADLFFANGDLRKG